MSFVFISYAQKDRRLASDVVSALVDAKLDVFWDERIRFGDNFRTIIDERLESAACVLVLWSKYSAQSEWVYYEAKEGLERKTLVEVIVDKTKPPAPFGGSYLAATLSSSKGAARSEQMRKLVSSISSRVGAKPTEQEFSLAAPRRSQEVTDSHLALIHTCWRSPRFDKAFGIGGGKTYRWDIALYGSKSALDRVKEVTYFLHPAYDIQDGQPPSFAVNVISARNGRLNGFRLSQIANGHSLVRAHVKVRGQNMPIHLSRYINLFNSRTRISDSVL